MYDRKKFRPAQNVTDVSFFVVKMREDGQAVDDALYALAMGPDTRVRHYESCVIGDVRYNTLARDEGRKTQNSAIMSTDTYDKEITKMHANIIDILQLQNLELMII